MKGFIAASVIALAGTASAWSPEVAFNNQVNSQAANTGVTQSAGGNHDGSNQGSNTNVAVTGGNLEAADNTNVVYGRHLLGLYGPEFSQNSQINSQAANTGVTQSAGGDGAYLGSNIGSDKNLAVTGGNLLAANNNAATFGSGRRLQQLQGVPLVGGLLGGGSSTAAAGQGAGSSVASQQQQTNGQQQLTGNAQQGSTNTGQFNVAPTWNQANSGQNGQAANNDAGTFGSGRRLQQLQGVPLVGGLLGGGSSTAAAGQGAGSSVASQQQQTNGQQQLTGNAQQGSTNTGQFNVAPTWNQANSGQNGQAANNDAGTFGSGRRLQQLQGVPLVGGLLGGGSSTAAAGQGAGSSVASQQQQTNGQQQLTGNAQQGSTNTGQFNVAPTWNQANSGQNGQDGQNDAGTFGSGRRLQSHLERIMTGF